MKFFIVEMERKSYVTLLIEAETEEEASELAIQKAQEGGGTVSDDINWTVIHTGEIDHD